MRRSGKLTRFNILDSLDKFLQIKLSIPHYLSELNQIQSLGELYSWIYFKLPTFLPLSKFPPYVCVELTNKCNFLCKHCWRETMDRPEGFMRLDIFKRIAAELDQHKHTAMKILGLGEASIHPQFREFMCELGSYRFKTLLYTNGALLQIFPLDEILSWRLDRIIFSIDGIDAPSYEKIKRKGKYHKLKNKIEKLYELRRHLNKNTPIIEIRHVMMPDETETQLKEFRYIWLKTADTVKFNVCEPSNGFAEEIDEHPPICRSIFRERGILWDGNIPLCGGVHRNSYCGNVNSSTIADLWRHATLEHLRKANKQRNFNEIPECARCMHCR